MKRQPTPQHLTWFLDIYRNNQLELNPPYQRKSVWTLKDRKFFLDTIFRNYPAPPIFVHREIDEKGFTTFNIVDGKQRLETILAFAENKISISSDFGDANLNGKKFKDLSIDYKRKFWDYVLVVDYIENIEGTNIDEVFDRVNRNSKNLQPQELRHARFDGWFINESESESDDVFWWNIKVSTKAKDKRMRNVQFISELLLVLLQNGIVGFSQDYLDEMYAKYDSIEETFEKSDIDAYMINKAKIKSIILEMNTVNDCIDIYGKTAYNLYSLWALIVLNIEKITDVTKFANAYKEFMDGVQVMINTQVNEEVSSKTENYNTNHYTYYINSKGATTDLPQRKARLVSLESIV
ncbi:DUF262 domain-containing protein [Chryseobacterium sp. ISL-6]|uniref:DUF262 domain-containing protein n=1 Tax=Chryseobacterium sp. ISL-6 TaxID=2819143 RepID=UPI001BE83E36|nr:DUF262 domain-containing protein [Chryseobacterium sp. ISL-6]MBT2623517.1 DUF262 domain-containing protein [Chryseobacterium sp. ISL-6]